MIRALSPGAIKVSVSSLHSGIDACVSADFHAIEISPTWVADLGVDAVNSALSSAGIVAAGWGLPVEWRKDETVWQEGLAKLPEQAKNMAAVGCNRCSTWVLPASNDLNYDHHRALVKKRFQPIADILGENGISLGLEFIGPKTLRDSFRHPFIYTLGAMLEFGKEIGPNVGLLLDAWHWYTSEGTLEDILALSPKDVVYVHVNDAPSGVALDEQVDNRRLLPGESGVINLVGFFDSLKTIGYTGPVCVEPFKDSLGDLPSDVDRLRVVCESLKKFVP